MFGERSRAVFLIALAVALGTSCSRSRGEPASTPPVSAVEVPAVPPETAQPSADPPRAERRLPRDEPVEEEALAIDIAEDAGVIQLSATSEGGVRFWGNFRKLDGGFSFQGGFNTGKTGSGPDAGSSGSP